MIGAINPELALPCDDPRQSVGGRHIWIRGAPTQVLPGRTDGSVSRLRPPCDSSTEFVESDMESATAGNARAPVVNAKLVDDRGILCHEQ